MKFSLFKSKKIISAAFLLGTSFLFAEETLSPQDFVIIEPKHEYNLNPRTANYSAEAQILTGLYEGLFSYDPVTLEPVYAMAKNYRSSRDKKRWTFELRDGLKFSNGEVITAEKIRGSFIELLATPDAPYASLLDIVQGAEEFRTNQGSAENVEIYASDEKTISFHLKTPASHLPKILCMPSFSVTAQDSSVFSGPFCLAERDENKIILEKNENYYDSENTKLEKITSLLSDDSVENVFAFNTGSADWISSSFDEKTGNQQ